MCDYVYGIWILIGVRQIEKVDLLSHCLLSQHHLRTAIYFRSVFILVYCVVTVSPIYLNFGCPKNPLIKLLEEALMLISIIY